MLKKLTSEKGIISPGGTNSEIVVIKPGRILSADGGVVLVHSDAVVVDPVLDGEKAIFKETFAKITKVKEPKQIDGLVIDIKREE